MSVMYCRLKSFEEGDSLDGKEYEELENMISFDTKSRGRFSVDRYRQLSLFQNHRHSLNYYISLISMKNIVMSYKKMNIYHQQMSLF